MYQVLFTKTAAKNLCQLDKRYQSAVAKAIDKLAQYPTAGEPLTGPLKGLWKLRFSRYRIIYQLDHGKCVIIIFDIAHRREVYR